MAVRLGVYAGLRAGEIFGLTWRHVDFDRCVLTIAHSYRSATKTGKTRQIPMSDELQAVLRSWRSRCPAVPEGVVCPLFTERSGWGQAVRRPNVQSLYAQAGVTAPASPWHALRHTFASHFLMSGGGLLSLQHLLGHSDLKMTSMYAHLSSDHIAAEVKRLHY